MELIKKLFLGIFAGLLLLTLSGTQALADQNMLVSKVFTGSREFTSVGGSWTEIKPANTSVEAEVRFKEDGEWTDWIELEEEEESENGITAKKYAIASANSIESFQYRYLFFGSGAVLPQVKDVNWTFIKAPKSIASNSADAPLLASNSALSEVYYLAASSSNSSSGVISRSRWGADESYRYLKDQTSEADLIELDPAQYEKYKNELKYSRVVKEDSKGKKYIWPLQYPTEVKKFIIHHTATTSNLKDPEQAIRDIYYYHAVTRGWGDIGYNYVIDPKGKIYEGRYGGEGVIGAHAGIGNNGSIGIAILGNYEENKLPEKILTSLAKFIAKKAKLHDIDPKGTSTFRGEKMPNIFGHRDIMATTCPGKNIYSKLSVLRTMAAKEIKSTGKESSAKKDYDFEDKSELYLIELQPDETQEITLKFENAGKEEWNSKTYILVNDDPKFEGVISFPEKSGTVLAKMKESKVKPGKTATFTFKIKAGKKIDTVYLDIAPMINGTQKPAVGTSIPVTVDHGSFKYSFVDSEYPPETMSVGEEFQGWVELKNTGNATWRKTGLNTVLLGTDHQRDRKSSFVSPASTRIGFLKENEVAPGDTGTFLLYLKAPSFAGTYKEYFTPVVEGVTWMDDSKMYFETVVYDEKGGSIVTEQTSDNKWQRGKSYTAWLKLRNSGKDTWTSKKMTFDFVAEKDLKISKAKLTNAKVAPGKIGTVEFKVTVDKNDELGKKSILIKPKMGGSSITKKPINFSYEIVKDGKSSSFTDPDIRIKLGFSGTPSITADGKFSVSADGKTLFDLKKDDKVSVTYSKSTYTVTSGTATKTTSKPVRFIPDDSAILRIDNFKNSPAWNATLNDNEYRGILEVRYDDDKLVVINELPLESYLKGLAEAANSDPFEKVKAVIVAARSYARFYIEKDQKFPGKPYNLDDNPNVSQKYLGYGFEKRSSNITKGVNDTAGEVVTYKDELVKTPYFSSSDGTKTRSAYDVWKWSADYLVPVSDSYCKNTAFAGHGVGLSGCGAKGMAEAGFTYLDILKHYYTGVEVEKL